MVFRRNKKNNAIAFIFGERWLTTVAVKLGHRQSVQVMTLCQRPIHTHDNKSLAAYISSWKQAYMSNPLLVLQLADRYYQTLELPKPKKMQLNGDWASAVLADMGYSSTEWRWDLAVGKQTCAFLLIKMADFYEQLQALKALHCLPDFLTYVPQNVQVSASYTGHTILPDMNAAQRAIYLAASSLKGV